MDGQNWIEEVCQTDAMRLRNQPKFRTLAVKSPGPTALDHLESRFVMSVKEFVGDLAIRSLIRQFERGRAVPLSINHSNKAVLQDTLDGRVRPKIFESVHLLALTGAGILQNMTERCYFQ